MGKKSRLKKERKNESAVEDSLDHLMSEFMGGVQTTSVAVLGRDGKPLDKQGRIDAISQMVVSSFVDDDSSGLEGIDCIAKMMGCSIFDARIPVINDSDDSEELQDLPKAAYMLGMPEVFEWLCTRAASVDIMQLRSVMKSIIRNLEHIPHEDIRFAMVTGFLKARLGEALAAGDLHEYVSHPEINWHRRPVGAAILSDFMAETEAARERRVLEDELAEAGCDSIGMPDGEATARALRI